MKSTTAVTIEKKIINATNEPSHALITLGGMFFTRRKRICDTVGDGRDDRRTNEQTDKQNNGVTSLHCIKPPCGGGLKNEVVLCLDRFSLMSRHAD